MQVVSARDDERSLPRRDSAPIAMDDDDMTPTKRKRYMRRTLPTSSGGLDYPLLTFLCGVGIIIGAFVLRKYAMEAVTYKTASGAVVSRYQWKRQKTRTLYFLVLVMIMISKR